MSRLLTIVFESLFDGVRKVEEPRLRGRLYWALVAAVVAVALPRCSMLYNGVDRYRGNWRMHEAAHQAWLSASRGSVGTHARFFVQGVRVTRVWSEPGHCPIASRDSSSHYRVDVQTYTFFAIPLERINFMCGGRSPTTGFGVTAS
jgi:hypothetical protein